MYQLKWDKMNLEASKNVQLSNLQSIEKYETNLQHRKLHSMAAGQDDSEIKIYSFARYVMTVVIQQNELLCLLEFTIVKSTKTLSILAKSDDPDFSNAIIDYCYKIFL